MRAAEEMLEGVQLPPQDQFMGGLGRIALSYIFDKYGLLPQGVAGPVWSEHLVNGPT